MCYTSLMSHKLHLFKQQKHLLCVKVLDGEKIEEIIMRVSLFLLVLITAHVHSQNHPLFLYHSSLSFPIVSYYSSSYATSCDFEINPEIIFCSGMCSTFC